jgi:hypothetical protein
LTFLNLWALWIAAAAVPALLILYFLKLRRREQTVPSTLLWKRAVQDLQVNAPFQRLRRNLLLLLQLLILALAILALARPIVETTVSDEDRVVLLIDRSASMNTLEADGQTRLERAKEQAVRLVKTLNQRSRSWRSFLSLEGAEARTQVMVIAFSNAASIISPFTTNTGRLEDLIRRIRPTDAPTDIREALALAEAYMAPPTMTTDRTPVSAETPSKIVLISDGGVPDLDDLVLQSGSLEFLLSGETRDNVGITALRTQRNYEEPEIVDVFLRVQNFNPEPVNTDVRLYVDGALVTGKAVALGPRVLDRPNPEGPPPVETGTQDAAGGSEPALPNPVSLSFELPLNRGAVIEARLRRDDTLPVDNTASAVIPPPRKLRVLVVSQGNRLLDSVLAGLPLAEFPFVKPETWESDAAGRFQRDNRSAFDVVIFDRYQPERLPVGNYLFINAVPPAEGVSTSGPVQFPALIWWDETHPILRYVALEYVFVAESLTLQLPPEAEVLAESSAGPVLARYARDGRHAVMLGFAIENTTWWTKQSFGVFMYNVVRYLGGGGAEVERGPTRPGQTLRIPVPGDAERVKLVRPDGERVTLKADAPGVAYYGGADRAGLYVVEDGVPEQSRFAVNLEDDWESDITPRTPGRIGTQPIQQVGAIRTATPEVWRWFIGAALVLVLFEWWVYNRRVMI